MIYSSSYRNNWHRLSSVLRIDLTLRGSHLSRAQFKYIEYGLKRSLLATFSNYDAHRRRLYRKNGSILYSTNVVETGDFAQIIRLGSVTPQQKRFAIFTTID